MNSNIVVLPSVTIDLSTYVSTTAIGEAGIGSRINLVRPEGFFPFVSIRCVVTTTISGGAVSSVFANIHPAASGGGSNSVRVGSVVEVGATTNLALATTGYTLADIWAHGAVHGLPDTWFSYNVVHDRLAGIIVFTPILRKVA